MPETIYDTWPIVRVVAPRVISDELLDIALTDFVAESGRRNRGCVALLDLRALERLTVSQRKRVTEAVIELDAQESMLGCAMVFESRLLRGILTAIFWVHRPRYPTRIFTSVADAEDWVQMLSSRGEAYYERSQVEGGVPASSVPPSHAPDEEDDFHRNPNEGSWILHSDATRSRNIAAERVGALRATGPQHQAFLAERKLSKDLSLWLGWLGPFSRRDEAFAMRDDMARRGVVLTVSRWSASD